jgi:very-short-patch-repair endonuclease
MARFPAGDVEVSILRDLRLPPPARVHRVDELIARDISSVEGLRVSSPERTLVDLCADEAEADVVAAADEMPRRRLATLERLELTLDRLAHRKGIRVLPDLVTRYQGGERPTESELEAIALEAIDAAGLPRPTKQVPIRAGGRVRRVDFHYVDQRIVVEADSFLHHSDPIAFERDRQRINALTARGYSVLRWTWDALKHRPSSLTGELESLLGARVSNAA